MTANRRLGGTLRDIFFLNNLAAVKAIADPQRVKILEILIRQQATVQQIAGYLQESPAKIHYHVRELLKHGVIELVQTVEKKGILEKYYRALARNYYIDQALGEFFQDNDANTLEVITRGILSWRRHELLKVDIHRVADTLVNTCLHIEPGEVVYIQGNTEEMDLAEALCFKIYEKGAYPHLHLLSPEMKMQMLNSMPAEQLPASLDYLAHWLDEITTMIMLEHIVDPLEIKAVDPMRVELFRRAWAKVRNKRTERKVKWAFVGYPTEKQSQAIGVSYVRFHDIFWRSMDIDYEQVGLLGSKVADHLTAGQVVRLKSPGGTDLQLNITGRQSFIEDGIISADDIKQGQPFINFPCGEVSIAPLEDSVEGIARCDFTFYNGQKINGIEMEFRQGILTNLKAEENESLLRQILLEGADDRNRVGELGIGFNPTIENPLGYPVYDSKAFARVHLSLGENRMFGGNNKSALNWPLVLDIVDVTVDGQQLIQAGKFVFK